MNRLGKTRSTAPRMLLALALLLALVGAVSSIAPPPTPAAAAGGLTSVGAGGAHTCGITGDGTLICWGDNTFGQLDGIPSGIFTQVSAGSRFTCAIKAVDATLECWGSDSSNQVSDTPSDPVTQVDAGAAFACAIRTDGTLVCWGNDSADQVSDAPDSTVKQVSAGTNYACAIKSDNTLTCWGNDGFGQVTPPAGTFKQVSVGLGFTCGITTTDALRCWGYAPIEATTPTTGTFKQVSAGDNHACALRMDDTIACWGQNDFSQLNDIPTGTFTQMSAGQVHTCAVRADGTVTCWGSNNAGQLGPTITNAPPPNPGPGPYVFSYTVNCSFDVSFSLTAGSLPPGLSLASDGTLSGTATTEGTYTGTVTLSSDFFPDFHDSQDFTLIVDLSPPTTAATASNADGTAYTFGDWTNQAVTVTLDARDTGSGVADTFYTIDSGGQQTYDAPFEITTEGAHALSYWSTDLAGNNETAHTDTVNIDLTLPVITITGNQGSYSIDQTIDIQCTASDALSGIATTDCADITGPATDFGPGSHTVTFTATDNAGNMATLPVTFSVAVTADGLCALTIDYAANRLAGNQLCYPLRLAQFGERLHIPGFTRATTLMYTLLVETQRGRTLTPAEAETLIALARSL